MMTMRDAIAKSLGRPTPDVAVVDAEAAELLRDLGDIRPSFDVPVVDRFIAKLTSEKLTGTVERLSSLQTLPDRVGAYLEKNTLPAQVTLSGEEKLRALDWTGIEVTGEIAIDTPAALSLGVLAIAETGSIVVQSSPQTPTLDSFLPLHHLVVVNQATIRPWLDDIWQEVDPRNHRCVNIITGTSGTADIEGKNVRGAHGPRFLHVFLVDA